MTSYDVIVIGAGASGLMCAIRAGGRGLSVLVLERADRVGQKILISGGGRCNFTNIHADADNYLSPNPHFCKSALSRYTPWHFVDLMSKYHLTYHEKSLGQLFCDQKSVAIVDMLINESQQYDVTLACQQTILAVDKRDNSYYVTCQQAVFSANKLVIACGGPSFAKLGASDLAVRLGKQFGLANTPFAPALVPLIFPEDIRIRTKALAGISLRVEIATNGVSFRENLLFTHRGISGPAVLQISSYWQKGGEISIDLCPDNAIFQHLKRSKHTHPQQLLASTLATYFPKKMIEVLGEYLLEGQGGQTLQSLNHQTLERIALNLHQWKVIPTGSEGMKKAEVSTGGISPAALSSKTFESKKVKGLYAIGEAVDVTGWLGGYNFQWAWASGWCCGDSL